MSTPSASTGPATPSGTNPPPTSPAPRSGLSGGAKVGIVLAVVLVVVLGVWAANLIPGVPGPFATKGGPSAISSNAAEGEAAPVAATHDAGALVLLAGVNSLNSYSFGTDLGSTLCPLTGGLSANITVPAVSGNYSNGNAELWLFIYYNSTAPSESIVAVVGSTAYFLGTIAGALCVSAPPFQALPAHPASSSSAASSLQSSAAPFTARYGSANSIYVLIENNTSTDPTWYAIYTPCGYDPTTNTTTGGNATSTFLGEANGSTGSYIFGYTESDVNCTDLNPTTPTYELFMFEVVASGSAGNFDTVLDLSPSAGLTTAYFGLSVTNVSTSAVQPTATVAAGCAYGAAVSSCTAGTGWYAVLESDTGTVLATYGNATPEWGNLAPATTNVTLNSGMSLVVVSNVQYDGLGYEITAVGTGGYSVSGVASL